MWLRTSCATTWITPVATIISTPMRSIEPSGIILRRLGLAQQVIGDDALLDLRGAFEDLGQPSIAPVTLDGVQGGAARAAEDLQRLGGHPLGRLGGEESRHHRFVVAAPLLVDLRAADC